MAKRRPAAIGAVVKSLAAAGCSQDEISHRLGLSKHRLRSRYFDALTQGQALAAERHQAALEADAADAALSPDDAKLLDAILFAFQPENMNSVWNNRVDGCAFCGGAKTIEGAIKWCQQYGKLLNYKYKNGR